MPYCRRGGRQPRPGAYRYWRPPEQRAFTSCRLDPESQLPEGFLQVRVTTKDGRRFTGVRLNEDTFTIQIRDLNGQLHSFLKQDLKELQKDTGKTPMPRFRTTMSTAETDHLVAYLVSLKGKQCHPVRSVAAGCAGLFR